MSDQTFAFSSYSPNTHLQILGQLIFKNKNSKIQNQLLYEG
jgi:hypothetical protein